MQRVKLNSGSYTRTQDGIRNVYHPGDVFLVNSYEIKRLGSMITLLEVEVKDSKPIKAKITVGEVKISPTGYQPIGGNWYLFDDGVKVQGKAKAEKRLKDILNGTSN